MREIYGLTRDLVRSTNTLAGAIAAATRPPTRLTNVTLCFADDRMESEMEGILCRPELEVLMDVVLTYLDENCNQICVPNYGTLAIYSQVVNSADPVMSTTLCNLLADLRDGHCQIPQGGDLPNLTSRTEVLSAAKAVLKYEVGMDLTEVPSFLRDVQIDGGEPKSGIYFDKEHYGVRGADNRVALLLNGDIGRFAASFCCSGSMGDIEILALVAQTLVCLNRDDVRLMESARIVRKQMTDENPRYGRMMEVVERIFTDGTDPILRDWQDWAGKTTP